MTKQDLFVNAHATAHTLMLTGQYASYHGKGGAFAMALSMEWAKATDNGIVVRNLNKRRARSTSRRTVVETTISKSRKTLFSRAVRFAKGYLGLNGTEQIKFVTAASMQKNVLGSCGGDTNSQECLVRNFRNINKTLDTLFHELTHAQQIQQGRLVQMQGGLRQWNNEILNNNNIEWSQRPWEQEAIKTAADMLKKFIK